MRAKSLCFLLLFLPVLVMSSCLTTQSSEWDIPASTKAEIVIENSMTSKPNIIIIIADDLGKSELSAYGATQISTPNIDKTGANGVVFNDAYVTSPVCAPSRAAILTGKYQQRYGFETQPMEFYPILN